MKTILSILVLVIAMNGRTQSYIDFGPKFLIGPSLMKSNVAFSNERHLHKPGSLAFGGGFKLAFDFNQYFALVGEILFFSGNERMDITENRGETNEYMYEKRISWTSMEIPLMARYNSDAMKYVEAGYVISKLNSINEENLGGDADPTTLTDWSQHYNTKMGGIIFGFGGYLWGQDNLGINAGLRFRYNLDNMLTNSAAKVDNSPNFANDAAVTGDVNLLSVMFNIEINYDMGFYFANSPCGRRRTLIFGN